MKERYAQTELQKAQNRIAFGEAEQEVGFGDEETVGLGLVGGSTGKIRAVKADPRIKAAVAKKHKNHGGNKALQVSGLSSSIAFTPVKGIELENPELLLPQKKQDKYFAGGAFKAPAPKQK
jgi:U4/U6 small nuclear ribonucleoprotein PRP31